MATNIKELNVNNQSKEDWRLCNDLQLAVKWPLDVYGRYVIGNRPLTDR